VGSEDGAARQSGELSPSVSGSRESKHGGLTRRLKLTPPTRSFREQQYNPPSPSPCSPAVGGGAA